YALSGWMFHVIDPSVPELIDEIDLEDYTMEIDFRGDFAYVVNGQDVAQINISDPRRPVLVAEYDLPNYGYDIAFYESYAYVPTLEQMTILDIAGDGSLSLAGSILSGATQCKSCHVEGTTLFMGKSESGMHTYDLSSSPDSPSLDGLVDTPGWAIDIEVIGDYAYVADGSMVGIGDGAFCTVDLSAPPMYSIVDTFTSPTGSCFEGCFAGTQYYILADGVNGIVVFSLADPAHPELIDSDREFASGEPVNNVDFHDGLIYVASREVMYILSCDEISLVDRTPPTVTLVNPTDGSFSACLNQSISIRVTDDSGVDWSSYILNINGVDHTSAGMLSDGETISYSPMIEWTPRVPIYWTVVEVCDTEGNCVSSPISGSFTIDYDSPLINSVTPEDASVVTVTSPLVRINLSDETAGIDPSSIIISYTIGSVEYSATYPTDIAWDGVNAVLTTLPTLADGDIVSLTFECADDVPYCGPNTSSESWSFSANLSGIDETAPSVSVSYPSTGSFSSVNSQRVSWNVSDVSDIDVSSIEIIADGVSYSVDGSFVTYSDGNLSFSGTSPWSEGEHELSIARIDDILGNSATSVGATSFSTDYTAPRINWVYPEAGEDFASPWAVQVSIVDRGAGVDVSAVRISIEGEEFEPIVSPEGDSAKVFTAMLDSAPADVDVSVCVLNIQDDISSGMPNSIADTCYSVEDIYELPLNMEILSIAPNPFNPACNIELILAEPGIVEIEAFDIDGRSVGLIFNGYIDGLLKMKWKPELSTGVYFLKFNTPCGVNVERVLLLK
ncbi:MAG: hypothetical protein ACTSWQ_10710, partial [Candidatus Thorarchaeota archaeon]